MLSRKRIKNQIPILYTVMGTCFCMLLISVGKVDIMLAFCSTFFIFITIYMLDMLERVKDTIACNTYYIKNNNKSHIEDVVRAADDDAFLILAENIDKSIVEQARYSNRRLDLGIVVNNEDIKVI